MWNGEGYDVIDGEPFTEAMREGEAEGLTDHWTFTAEDERYAEYIEDQED